MSPASEHSREPSRPAHKTSASFHSSLSTSCRLDMINRSRCFARAASVAKKPQPIYLSRVTRPSINLRAASCSTSRRPRRKNSLWRGDCFVFDTRVALDHQLQRADFEQCYGCRRPLSAADRASPLYEPGISCAGCHARLQAPQRRGFAERRHQVKLAEQRGDVHIGALMSEDEVS